MLDFATALGLLIGLAVTLLVMLMGGDLSLFLNYHAFLLVFGGVFAASLTRYPFKLFFTSLALGAKQAFKSHAHHSNQLVEELSQLSNNKRKAQMSNEAASAPLQRGLKLIQDGFEAEYIRLTLEREREVKLLKLEDAAKIFRTIGEIAPAFGMIGTLIGMVQMFATMQEPTLLGPFMATALLATLYSALIANVVALPLAEKLERRIDEEDRHLTLIIEGILALKAAKSPLYIRESLNALLPSTHKEWA